MKEKTFYILKTPYDSESYFKYLFGLSISALYITTIIIGTIIPMILSTILFIGFFILLIIYDTEKIERSLKTKNQPYISIIKGK